MKTDIKKPKRQTTRLPLPSQKMGLGNVKTAKGNTLHVKSILVPTDFSELSSAALEYASAFAKLFGAKIILLHVVEPISVAELAYSDPLLKQSRIVADSKRRLAQAVKDLGNDAGLIANCLVVEGRSFHEITETAQSLKSDLIIISTHGYGGLKRLVLGSTTERVVRHAPCTVLVLRHQKKPRNLGRKRSNLKIRKILAPVDFSGFSLDALSHAIAYAKRFGAELTLLNAVHPAFFFTAADDEAVLYAELVADTYSESQRQIGKLLKRQPLKEMKVRSLICKEDPRTAIINAAANQRADLIVLATHGRTGLQHVLLGSVAEYVVRHARCAVLVVHQRQAR